MGLLVEIGFFWFQGRWFERLSLHRWLLLAASLAALRFGVMAAIGGNVVAPGADAADACDHLRGAACRVHRPGHAHFPGPAARARSGAVQRLGYGASGVIGGVAGGALIERWGFPAVFGAAALSAVLSALCVLRSRHHALRAQAAG